MSTRYPVNQQTKQLKMTEQEIRRYLRQMKEEDSQIALKKFYDLCYDRFFRIAYYYLHSEASAQEVVLDVFFKIWQTRESLHQIVNLEDYFFILIRNAALNRRERDSHIPETINSVPEPSDLEHSPEEQLISEELFAQYVKALDRLPPRCREVFIRIREEKQSYAQVAEELGISIHTVDAQLQKAIQRLIRMLSLK